MHCLISYWDKLWYWWDIKCGGCSHSLSPEIIAFPPHFKTQIQTRCSLFPPPTTHISSSATMPPKQNTKNKLSLRSQSNTQTLQFSDDDDDFQNPTTLSISLTQKPLFVPSSIPISTQNPSSKALKPTNGVRSSKKPRRSISTGKENVLVPSTLDSERVNGDVVSSNSEIGCSLDSIDFRVLGSSSAVSQGFGDDDSACYAKLGCDAGVSDDKEHVFKSGKGFVLNKNCGSKADTSSCLSEDFDIKGDPKLGFKIEAGYRSNSIESRLLAAAMNHNAVIHDNHFEEEEEEDLSMDFELGEELNDLIKLCSEVGTEEDHNGSAIVDSNGLVQCPLCGVDISDFSDELRQVHTNECLDRDEIRMVVPSCDNTRPGSPPRIVDVSPVLQWLQGLGLSRYEEAFIKEEIDWDTLQWLTEEDLVSMGVTALGPRKKIVQAVKELRKVNNSENHNHGGKDASKVSVGENMSLAGNKLITEFFPGSSGVDKNRDGPRSVAQHGSERRSTGSAASKVRNRDRPSVADSGLERRNTPSASKRNTGRSRFRNGTIKDIPSWCCIPGTPFRVDAFRYLRGDCSHWFLTHFHMDHYQGLTRSFCNGKIYCSAVTAQLVNMKIGIPWDKIQVLPINQKINIAGIDVTCLDANHCPGSIIILFEPPNDKAVLHTGDFRFSDSMTNSSALQSCPVHTLILDTTYCNPQYDFPKQDSVIQFVIEAIQAEAFNPKTLFLIGSYTIGKERLFLEVARSLRKKVYVGRAKLRILECLGLPDEDMKWFTANENESYIHVVPMWTIASFKRMNHISNQYMGRFNLIIAFSPTGWTFNKGRKKPQGRRCQQGTIIRYEVPYSEHCSFTELKAFVQLVSPENIIPSVNNDGPESADAMIALLKS